MQKIKEINNGSPIPQIILFDDKLNNEPEKQGKK